MVLRQMGKARFVGVRQNFSHRRRIRRRLSLLGTQSPNLPYAFRDLRGGTCFFPTPNGDLSVHPSLLLQAEWFISVFREYVLRVSVCTLSLITAWNLIDGLHLRCSTCTFPTLYSKLHLFLRPSNSGLTRRPALDPQRR